MYNSLRTVQGYSVCHSRHLQLPRYQRLFKLPPSQTDDRHVEYLMSQNVSIGASGFHSSIVSGWCRTNRACMETNKTTGVFICCQQQLNTSSAFSCFC